MLEYRASDGAHVASASIGRVVFRPIGYRQLSIDLQFDAGAGREALAFCRRVLDAVFTETDTLIIRGHIMPSNKASRMFTAALGMTTVSVTNKFVEKRMTKARWGALA